MARRKQSNRPRTASGRLSRSRAAQATREADNMAVALAQPHRARLPKELRHSRLAENELGRLVLAGEITEIEFAAGQNYRRLAVAYRRDISAPGGMTSALGRLAADAFADCRTPSDDSEARHDALKRRYASAKAALLALADGPRIAAVVGRVAIHDVGAGDDVVALKAGLSELAVLWKLSRPVESAESPARRPRRLRSWRVSVETSTEEIIFDDDGS
ncbi:hypothetical protein [Ancylobacter oerskovii]|uniref:Uncharacterized protein n=1 Tax=Ancylobacter oerskovii TaxID=459519 RepID=A0ABW4Z0Q2_9HYPH|nr:hypothetical protein [Ancylobacter oerskovii]MBS7542994.1 hypothetical protein [Ancylobacter oerskovii]